MKKYLLNLYIKAQILREDHVRIPLKWGTDSGDVGQRRSGATLVTAMISEVPHLSQDLSCLA